MTVRPARIDVAEVGPGLAWAYEFDEHGRGRPVADESHIDLMHGRRFVWAHLMLANARSRDWIEEQAAVPPEARELLLSQDAHPRLEWRGDALWGTLYDIQREYQAQGDDPTDLRFVLTPHFLLTARRHPVLSAESARTQIEAGVEFESSAELFEKMLVATADTVGEAAHRIAADLDSIEDRVLSENFSDESGSLLKLRRAVSRQNRLIHASLSVLEQVEQHRAEAILQVYRDLAGRVRQRVASFHADLHLQGERARLLQEEMSAQLASATNRNLFVLTIVTTVLLPPAFVTGFFGMNTKGLPFAESDNGTLYAAAFCVAAAGLVYLLIRRYRMFS
jgi:zinc transporter